MGQFLCRFYFCAQTLQNMTKGCWMSYIRAFGLPVHEKIFKNSPNFTPFCPNRGQSLDFQQICIPIPQRYSYQIWFKSVQWFWRISVLNVFSYLSLCKIRRPLVGSFSGESYFYFPSLQSMSQGCCISNIRVFQTPVHEKIFFNSPNFTRFCPLLGPNKCQPLYFCKLESPFPKDASYQI